MLRFTTPFHCRAVCFKELSDLCPSHIRVAVIVKGVKFPLSAEHVVQVLHALPDRIEFVPLREDCPHDFDQDLKRLQISRAQEAKLFPGHLTHDFRQLSGTQLIAGNAQRKSRLRFVPGGIFV